MAGCQDDLAGSWRHDDTATRHPEFPAPDGPPSLLAGWRVARIAEFLDIKAPTVHSWKERDGWEAASPTERVEGALEARLVQLIGKESKEGRDFKEIDLLGRQIERLARVHRYQETGREADLNPNIEARNAGPKKKPRRNALTDEQLEALETAFLESLFEYQRKWLRAGERHRIRNILKSRQIGATWYFARESIVDAFKTGRNKIFLSASKAQAHIFRSYIVQFVKETCDVDLKGDPIVLDNGAELYFLGTNSKTAQAITVTSTWMSISGSTASRSSARSPVAWPCTRSGDRPTSRRRPVWGMKLSVLVRRAVQQATQEERAPGVRRQPRGAGRGGSLPGWPLAADRHR